jgi:hypothetical protein
MNKVVTKEEFLDWKQQHVTQLFMSSLDKDREYMKEVLVAGTEDDNNLRGRITALTLILGLTYEDFMESLVENR